MPSLEIALEKKNFRGYTPLGVSISFELVILEIVLSCKSSSLAISFKIIGFIYARPLSRNKFCCSIISLETLKIVADLCSNAFNIHLPEVYLDAK